MENKETERLWSNRAFAATGSVFGLLIMCVTGFQMAWFKASWFFGLNHGQIKNLHWYASWAFTVFAIWHLVFNFRPLVCHFKRRAAAMRLRREWVTAVVIVTLLGAYSIATAPVRPPGGPGGPGASGSAGNLPATTMATHS